MPKIDSTVPPSDEDQELLRIVAEAALMDVAWDRYAFVDRATSRRWNPLADDGDAFRLAAKVGIGFHVTGQIMSVGFGGHIGTYGYAGNTGSDLAELRRAIVVAVVEKYQRLRSGDVRMR